MAIQKLQKPANVDGVHLSIGASFGIKSIDRDEDAQAIALISQTDLLLYEMKKHKAEAIEILDIQASATDKNYAA